MAKLDAEEALNRIGFYGSHPNTILNNYTGTDLTFVGMSIGIDDLTSLKSAADVSKIFVGIGAFEETSVFNYTLLAIGLDNDGKRVKNHAYDYGQRIPPKELEGWDECAPEQSQKKIIKILKMFTKHNIRMLIKTAQNGDSIRIGWNLAFSMLDYYHQKPSYLGTSTNKFYGVIFDKSELDNFIGAAIDVKEVAFCFARASGTSPLHMVGIGIKDDEKINCDRIYSFETPATNVEMMYIRIS